MAATIEIKLSADPRQQPPAPSTPPAVQPTPAPANVAPSPRPNTEAETAALERSRREQRKREANEAYDRTYGLEPEEEAAERLKKKAREKKIRDEMNRLDPPEVKFAPPPKTVYPVKIPTVKPATDAEIAKDAAAKGGGLGDIGKAAGAAGIEGLGGLIGAAGPVGLAVAAVKLIKDQIDKTMTKIGDAFRDTAAVGRGVSEVTSSAARGENAEAVGQVADHMVELAGKVPLVGDQLKLLGGTAVDLTRSFKDVVMAFVERGRELSQYSGAAASSYAVGDVRQLLADIKEGQTLGPDFARLNDATTELSIMLRDMLLPIKQWVVEKLANIMETLVDKVGKAHDFAIKYWTILEHLPDIIYDQALAALTEALCKDGSGVALSANSMKTLRMQIARAIADARKDEKIDETLINDFFGMLDRAVQGVGPIDPRIGNRPLPGGLGIPLVP